MANLIDFTLPNPGETKVDWNEESVTNHGTLRENVKSYPIQNRSIGARLGITKSYRYGFSNPALRPVIPKGV